MTSEKTTSVPTAFVAAYGKDKPFIGILLKYDGASDGDALSQNLETALSKR